MRDLVGRNFLITGANGGVGRAIAAALAARGGHLFLGCRSTEVAESAAAELRAQAGAVEVEPLVIDLASLASVRAAADAFEARRLPLHGLVNNAGLAGTRAVSRDGFELTFAVNHLGHFLLTRRLESALRAGAPSRIVNVASQAHRAAKAIDFAALRKRTRTLTGVHEYAVSKLCNVLFTRELARRWAGSGVAAFTVHPGVVATRIWRRVPQPVRWLMTRSMLSPEQGARTPLYCLTAPELAGASGGYFVRDREEAPSATAQDDALAARLWDESEVMIATATAP